ncbi:CD59 glycoprotein-like [Clupea harengus]|uniref:CD59 glycoprotein-like n=1 Tax=Clupea harengus TaxID=7950 RepID=A0A6P3VJD3_CLUHA|nr:CD59 glycoprotein-like [Clupea harengus]
MKAFLVAVLLVLAVANGSALKCRHCVPSRPGTGCTVTTETCSSSMDACVAARFLFSPFSYFNRCIKMSDCRILQTSPYIKANCCQTDLCNISSL